MDARCPFATWTPSPNYTTGRSGLKVRGLVLHIAEGGYAGSVSWLCNPAAGASAHFMIAKDGRLTQMVEITSTAWGNGLRWTNGNWYDPEGSLVHPSWSGLTPGVDPNAITISCEHEGHSGEPWTPEMQATDVRLAKWLAAQTGLVWQTHVTLIGHYEISPVNRAHCPGPGCPFDRIALLANGSSGGGLNYVALWGTAYPFFEASGIAQEWKRSAMVLGAAASDETKDAEGRIWRLFHGGAVSYDPRSGACMSYFARASS